MRSPSRPRAGSSTRHTVQVPARPSGMNSVRIVSRRAVAAPKVRIGEDGGRAALLVDGVVQSISPADGLAVGGYWAAMVPDERPRSALILGLGGGTLARLLQARWGDL